MISTNRCLKPGKCRIGRPACRHCRKATRCECGNYIGKNGPYPHRKGSPLCVHNPNSPARMWEELENPIRRTG